MTVKIKIKKKSTLKEAVEPIEEIFGNPFVKNPWSKKQATTQTMASKGMSKEQRDEISDMLTAHDPGSSEHKDKKNPYNIPEGEPPIDATFLVDLYTRLTVSGDKLRIQSADRTMGTLGLYMKRAAAAESEQQTFSAINRAKLYLDDMYRRLLAMGVDPGDPSTHEPCPRGQKRVDGECVDKGDGDDDSGPGEDAVIECDEERGFEWDAAKGKCVNKETGEEQDPKCPEEGQIWDAEAGKCVGGGEDGPEGEGKSPVPLYKYAKEKGEDGKRFQPLSAKLAKAGMDKTTIKVILRSIAKQLKANNIEITEGLLREAASMVLERLNLTVLVEEMGPDTSRFADMTDVEAGSDEEEGGEKEEVKYEYEFNMQNFKTNREYKNIRSRWKQAIKKAEQEPTEKLFIKHTNEFAEFIGPFIPPKLFNEAQSERDEINKVTDVGRLVKNKEDIIAAFKRLKKTSTGDHGAKIIILKAIGDNRRKMTPRINAMLDNISRNAVEAEEETETGKEKLRFDQVPDLFKKYWGELVSGKAGKRVGGMSSEEAWEKLPSGKEGRKRQEVTEHLLNQNEMLRFAKIVGILKEVEGTATGTGADAGRSVDTYGQEQTDASGDFGKEDVELTKVGWFKTQEDAPDETSNKDLMTRNFEPRGAGDNEKESNMKAFVGGLLNKMGQNIKGREAADKGFGEEAYGQGDKKIRISTLNQQLKTIDLGQGKRLDQKGRRAALKVVQKFLKGTDERGAPWMKIHNLKLSESEIKDFASQIVEAILKSSR